MSEQAETSEHHQINPVGPRGIALHSLQATSRSNRLAVRNKVFTVFPLC